jgi:hypothetical protein
MPFIGIGLHILVALFFAVHSIRNGQPLYWLIILFSFPLLGSVAYLLAVYLPSTRFEQGARKVVANAAKVLDPMRELREARAAFEYTPTAQNQMRVANALLDAEQFDEAVTHYEQCLRGPFASDLEVRWGAAKAYMAAGQTDLAIEHLERLSHEQPQFREETVTLLLARAYAYGGRRMQAKVAFENAYERFGSFESKAEFLIWALISREDALAAKLQAEVHAIVQRWNRTTKDMHRSMLRRLDAAYEGIKQSA